MSTPENHTDPSLSPEERALYRYLNDEMSNKEKYAFEKEMEKDPFAYEAMEGLQGFDVKDISKDLARLRKGLIRSEKPSSFSFWKIAAAVCLVMLAGVSAWRLTTINPVNETVSSSKTLVEDSSVASGESPSPAVVFEEESQDTVETEPPLVLEEAKPVAEAKRDEVATRQPPEEAFVAEAADDEVVEDTAVTLDIAIADDITERAEPVSGQGAGAITREDIALREIEAAPAPVKIDAPKLTDINAVAASDDTGAARKLTLTDAGAEKKTASRAAVAENFSAEATVAATPENGWEAFATYIRENQLITADMVDGRVFLTFTINEQGMPQNIRVIRALCEACDREAIRLLENSGRWQYNDDVTRSPVTTISITFQK